MPMTLASVAGAIIAGRVTVRPGSQTAAIVGLVLMATRLIVLALAVSAWNSFALVISSMAVGEIGFMLAGVALTIMAMSSLGDEHAGLVNTSNQLGGGLGLGVVAAVVAAAATKAEVDATALALAS